MLLCLERAHFKVVGPIIEGVIKGQMGFADGEQLFLYEKLGLITVYANLMLECKVCGTQLRGFDAAGHLQTKEHLERRRTLEAEAQPDADFCEGCPMLIQEENPYYDVTELVCRLGYCEVVKYVDEDSHLEDIRVIYRIDEDLFRPDMCREKLGTG